MKKNMSFLICMVITTALILGACERNSSDGNDNIKASTSIIADIQKKDSAYPFTVTDMLGNTVKLEKKPERIAAISPKLIDIFLSCGGTSICSVETEDGSTVKDSAKKPPSIGKASNPDIIAILELEPDLVFAEAALQNEVISMLQKNEVPVIALNADNQKSIQEAEKIIKEAAGFN